MRTAGEERLLKNTGREKRCGVVCGVFMAVSLVQFYLDGLQRGKPRHRSRQNNPENGKEPEDGQS